MQIELEKLKRLILEMEPSGFTANILTVNGYGQSTIFGAREFIWNWNKEKVLSLNEEGVEHLIKLIVWT